MPRIFDNIETGLLPALQETLELSDHADHKRTGDPIVIWRDGKVVKIPADQIEVREPEAEYGQLKEKGK